MTTPPKVQRYNNTQYFSHQKLEWMPFKRRGNKSSTTRTRRHVIRVSRVCLPAVRVSSRVFTTHLLRVADPRTASVSPPSHGASSAHPSPRHGKICHLGVGCGISACRKRNLLLHAEILTNSSSIFSMFQTKNDTVWYDTSSA